LSIKNWQGSRAKSCPVAPLRTALIILSVKRRFSLIVRLIKNSIISVISGLGAHKTTLLTAGRRCQEVRQVRGHAYLPVSTNGAAMLIFSRVMPPNPTVAVWGNRPVSVGSGPQKGRISWSLRKDSWIRTGVHTRDWTILVSRTTDRVIDET
jgi:hypothetical protein